MSRICVKLFVCALSIESRKKKSVKSRTNINILVNQVRGRTTNGYSGFKP